MMDVYLKNVLDRKYTLVRKGRARNKTSLVRSVYLNTFYESILVWLPNAGDMVSVDGYSNVLLTHDLKFYLECPYLIRHCFSRHGPGFQDVNVMTWLLVNVTDSPNCGCALPFFSLRKHVRAIYCNISRPRVKMIIFR